jgi:hypothetical protein
MLIAVIPEKAGDRLDQRVPVANRARELALIGEAAQMTF